MRADRSSAKGPGSHREHALLSYSVLVHGDLAVLDHLRNSPPLAARLLRGHAQVLPEQAHAIRGGIHHSLESHPLIIVLHDLSHKRHD